MRLRDINDLSKTAQDMNGRSIRSKPESTHKAPIIVSKIGLAQNVNSLRKYIRDENE